MSQSYPPVMSYTKQNNSSRIYFVLGIFVIIMIVIFRVFFQDNIRHLLLGSIYNEIEHETEIDPLTKPVHNKKEVYNIGKNIYTYDKAKQLCKSLNGTLATPEQVNNAYENGAEWCNYGWTQGQNAMFPIQKETWEHIQTRPEPYRYECGYTYGVNGGFFENSNLEFGVNCYGVKPQGSISKHYELTSYDAQNGSANNPLSKEDIDKLGIIPFNSDKWSKYS